MKALLGLAFALVLTGCATIIKGGMQPLSVNSNVEGASVFLNGMKLGVTPLITQVERKKDNATLVIKKKGYQTKQMILTSDVEGVFWVNLLSGGPFGSTTDYASESMFKYAPGSLNIDLSKKK